MTRDVHTDSSDNPEPQSSAKRTASRDRFRRIARQREERTSFAERLQEGDRKALSKAITLVESGKPADQQQALQILERCLPQSGNSVRLGITGVPGVGKSTFIDRLGKQVIRQGHQLAVLTVDPSSTRSGGSILGDKTRMGELANLEEVFIRPSPTGGSLGGVARKTRESLLLCEAAGFDYIFIETVGVGQSETAVRSMVDCFLLLALPGSGDELQGIKRGIVEMADLVVINKAEQPDSKHIRQAVSSLNSALRMLPESASGWSPEVLTCSALEGERIDTVWDTIQSFIEHIQSNGYFEQQRRQQARQWLYDTIDQQLKEDFYRDPPIKKQLKQAEEDVMEREKSAFHAAFELLQEFRNRNKS